MWEYRQQIARAIENSLRIDDNKRWTPARKQAIGMVYTMGTYRGSENHSATRVMNDMLSNFEVFKQESLEVKDEDKAMMLLRAVMPKYPEETEHLIEAAGNAWKKLVLDEVIMAITQWEAPRKYALEQHRQAKLLEESYQQLWEFRTSEIERKRAEHFQKNFYRGYARPVKVFALTNWEDEHQQPDWGNHLSGFKCHVCRETGHFKTQCPVYQRRINNKYGENSKYYNKVSDGVADKLYPISFPSKNLEWFIDSGASQHACSDKTKFLTLNTHGKKRMILANGEVAKVEGVGTIKLNIRTSMGIKSWTLEEAMWIPTLDGALLSVSSLINQDHSIRFKSDGCYIDDYKVATIKGDIYVLHTVDEEEEVLLPIQQPLERLHENVDIQESVDIREDVNIPENLNIEQSEPQEVQRRIQPERHAGLPYRLRDDFVLNKLGTFQADPRNFKEASLSIHADEWKTAMQEELNAIEKNQTWELADLPPGRTAIGSKWVFKTKLDENGHIVQRKARLVAQGFSQKFGVDYDEVFAPVARSTTFRMLMAVAGKRNYTVKHYDIKSAFLNGELHEEIYLKQPPGYQMGTQVYKLKKALYGLKQSAHVWNKTLHEQLTKNGCKQNESDACLYVKKNGEKVMYILIHVDDMLAATNDDEMLNKTIWEIGKKFEVKNLGGVKHFLGIDVEKSEGKFFISQPQYIDLIAEEAGLTNAKKSEYPLDPGYFKQEESQLLHSNDKYRKLIGMLLYLTTNTRPDIAAAVSILSKKVEKPTFADWNELKRVVRYIMGTRDEKLKLNDGQLEQELHAYSDADWAEDRTDRKSHSGYYCALYGGTISWSCRKQDIVTQSSTEAEYVALAETCKELSWLRKIAEGFDIDMGGKLMIRTDSQSCIALIRFKRFSNRTKHIETKYHYIRDEVEKGRVELQYVNTNDNIADMMTKPLNGNKLVKLRRLAGLKQS